MSFVASVQADISNFESNLDRAQARMDAFADTIGNRIAKIGQSFQMIGGAMSIGVTAPLTAMGLAAFNVAADLEDALGATDQIFKSSAEGVKDWAGKVESYFGITKGEALEYSNMMGSMLVNIGKMTEEQAGKQGEKLIELAGDLTAMYGGQTQDAVRALTGALKGNNTMLDNYGMAVNDALVKSRALSMGLIKQGEEMSLSAKQAATLSLIYEQSAAAQGQAAREADGASGSMRALRTEVTNLTTELGEHLLPIITPFISRVKDIVASFREMTPESQRLIVVIGGITAAIGPFLLGLGTILRLAPLVGTAFSVMTGPIGIAVAAIAGAALLIIRNWESISKYFTSGNGSKLWSNISQGAQKLWSSLSEIFNKVYNLIISIWDKIGKNLKSIVGDTFDTIVLIIGIAINSIVTTLNVLIALFRMDFKGALSLLKDYFSETFGSLMQIVKNTVSTMSNQIAGFLKVIGADGLGKSLESWADGLRVVSTESKATAEKVEEVTAKVSAQTISIDTNTDSKVKAKKAETDYRLELDKTLASLGLYEGRLAVVADEYKNITDVAKKAGASQLEFQTIASANWVDNAIIQLDRFGDAFKENKLTKLTNDAITIPIKIESYVAFDEFNKQFANAKMKFEELSIDLSSGLANTVSGMMSSLGEALATGGDVLGTIGVSLIKGLGDMAKSIGEQMIAFGTAALALKLLMSNPFLAIAAGAALVALGSMASASVSKQVSGGSSSGYSSVSSNSTPPQLRGAYSNPEPVKLVLEGDQFVGYFDQYNNKKNRIG